MKTIANLPAKLLTYLSGVRWELGQMEWLSWRMTFGYTLLVIVFAVVLILLIVGFDSIFVAVRDVLLKPAI
jgi:preprotein translocase SecE subunit